MAVTAPETVLREALIDALEDAFDGDTEAEAGRPGPFTFLDDRLHEARGSDAELSAGGAIGGVYPERSAERPGQSVVLETTAVIQLFGYWRRDIDPAQTVSPALAEEYAERIRRAVQGASYTTDNHLWFFQVVEMDYPKDPTGNITRCVARVRAYSDNPAIIETTG